MNKYKHHLISIIHGMLFFFTLGLVHASAPLWTLTPLTDTRFSIGVNDSVSVQYRVTNQSKKIHSLSLIPIPGIRQDTSPGNCPNPFTLAYQQSCTLTLYIQGTLLLGDILGGPTVCQQGNRLQCYQPSQTNSLLIRLIQESPVQHYTISPSAGSNGSISPNTVQTVNSGGSISFTALPDTGYGVSQWLLDGNAVQTGGTTYQLSNIMANHTVEATFSRSTLSPSVSLLALSVHNTASNPALTGNTRSISIHNTGSEQAVGLQVSATGLPTGTTMNAGSCSSTLNPGDYCTIAFTPGSIASSGINNQACTTGNAPVPALITVSAGNAPATLINVVVLGYGCIYQSGYLFALDDTTPVSGSVGGTVLAEADQISQLSRIIWSSNGQGSSALDVSYDVIYGIGETSTDSAPFPDSNLIAGQTACNGRIDGACNSNNIIVYYSLPNTNPAVNLSYYAAGVCRAYTGGNYNDWYLPAVCQMSLNPTSSSGNAGCIAGTQNIGSNLLVLRGRGCRGVQCLLGGYHSSTELSGSPTVNAWGATFPVNTYTLENKNDVEGIRCVRELSI